MRLRSIKFKTLLAAFVLAVAAAAILRPHAARAVTAADWQAGNILSDELLYTQGTLSEQDIQGFLESQVSTCDTFGQKPYAGTSRGDYGTARGNPPPYTCLKDYSLQHDAVAADSYCSAIGAGTKTAAGIIYEVAHACNINSKVLMVLLEKEQHLITDDWPWPAQYRAAAGYGCPDSAPCDSQYAGLFNQLYRAARQFRAYAANSGNYRIKPYQNNYIYWNLNSGTCGGSTIYIENAATAGLYNYTPYQPNDAALANMYGTGDGCSSYGNRNFWRLYNDWFGSTHQEDVVIDYKSHLSRFGWTDSTLNSGVTGTTGQSRAMEAFRIQGDVEYRSYNVTNGWQPTVSKGMVSGTTGQSLPIQAIQITPLASISAKYSLYYRVHVSNIGWMGWAHDGEITGVTGGTGYSIEAIQIRLIPTNVSPPSSSAEVYRNLSIVTPTPPLSLSITSHVGFVGWQPTVTDGMVTGTTEQHKRIEALKITLNNSTGLAGEVAYAAHVSNIGWQPFVRGDAVSGTTGQARRVESVRLLFTGPLSGSYDIWYRAYIEGDGWLGWTKNGAPAGSVGLGKQLEALEVRVSAKNSLTLPSTTPFMNPNKQSVPTLATIAYRSHVGFIGWQQDVGMGLVSGTTGQSKPLEALQISALESALGTLSITCSAYVRGTGWTTPVNITQTCGTTGQSKPLEAIKLTLGGDAAESYQLTYQVHVSQLGWLDWQADDSIAGTPDSGKQIEAISIKIEKK